jgi:hypothetical protein
MPTPAAANRPRQTEASLLLNGLDVVAATCSRVVFGAAVQIA